MQFVSIQCVLYTLNSFGVIYGRGVNTFTGNRNPNKEVCEDCPENHDQEELTWALITLASVTFLFLLICFCRFYPKLRALCDGTIDELEAKKYHSGAYGPRGSCANVMIGTYSNHLYHVDRKPAPNYRRKSSAQQQQKQLYHHQQPSPSSIKHPHSLSSPHLPPPHQQPTMTTATFPLLNGTSPTPPPPPVSMMPGYTSGYNHCPVTVIPTTSSLNTTGLSHEQPVMPYPTHTGHGSNSHYNGPVYTSHI
ncbi:uncharacterized protein LOC141857693 isoform X2 [Brevipalpus obovatus]|uniref:uncharacterized protein LOC141857693 isoform X2 n=1 Tax=Brevipalpus obovatus TaxID=246614 RepID=UPI003D9F7A7D